MSDSAKRIIIAALAKEYWAKQRAYQWDKFESSLFDPQAVNPIPEIYPVTKLDEHLADWRLRNRRASVPSHIIEVIKEQSRRGMPLNA